MVLFIRTLPHFAWLPLQKMPESPGITWLIQIGGLISASVSLLPFDATTAMAVVMATTTIIELVILLTGKALSN